ncbi:uncharacterized protein LTR77_006842 [Saxophila tyrrhenica]|uniref:Cytochrome P450 monooxygenase n=1 Tax=Saxophila tyrrhenica TaxID=1690608 RepID=A0AAV9P6F9_9PEZI|nr:hypothetical protein LTR77_006842 [Saxophila tyrrhenica]
MKPSIDSVGNIQPPDLIKESLGFAALFIVYFLAESISSVYLGPLSKFPGPKLWAFTKLPSIKAMVSGNEGQIYSELHQKYGPVVRVGPRQLSYAGGAQAWKTIYGFKKHGSSMPYKDPLFYGKSLNGTPNIIVADDANHSRQRKILAHAFSDKALKEQEPLLKRWAQLLRTKLRERADGKDELDMVKYYNFTTFDVMGDLTFSEGLNMLEGSDYSPWVKTIFGSIKNATFFRGIRVHDAVSKYILDEFVFKSKKVRTMAWEHWRYTTDRLHRRLKREPEHEDLWAKIMAKDEADGGLTMGEHESNASLFMIAGTETTATALSGTTYHLLRNPDKMQKLIGEVRGAFSDFDDVTLEGLAKMKYLQAVLQEGLRMYPPVPIALPRVTPTEGAEIDGMPVPGDVTIGVHQLATYRMPEHFKNAYEFHPERWLNDPEYKDDSLDALEPFSVGPRNCLGKNLAWHEMRVLLVTVLLHFDLKLSEDSKTWSDQKIYTLWEKKPLLCSLTPCAKT